MSMKVRLTESQYDKLKGFILEATFQEVLADSVQKGDVIRIGFKDKTRNFKVIDAMSGQIQMDNIDDNSDENVYRAFMSTTSLSGGDLKLSVVNKETEPDKVKDPRTWTKKIFKGVTDIELLRNDTVVDKVGEEPEQNKPLEKAVSDDFKLLIDDVILTFINHTKEGTGVNFKMEDGETISMCCMGRNGGKFSFNLNSETNISELKAWDLFGIELKGDGEKEDEDLYEQNKHLIRTKDEGQTFDFRLLGSLGEKRKYVWLSGITDVEPTTKCAPKPKKPKEEKPNEKEEEELIDDAEVAMHLILNDPTLKKAFYKQPSLWNLFVANMQGKEATGSGIVPTLDIVGRYMNKRLSDKLGATFMEGETVKYELVDGDIIFKDRNEMGTEKEIKLHAKAPYFINVGGKELDDNFFVLVNYDDRFKILVKESTDVPDVFICDIVKKINTGSEFKNDVKHDIRIKFLQDDKNAKGYNPKTK